MSKKPKICLIYTGGTIGMIETPDGLRPPNDPSDFLKIAPELREIDSVPLLNKDSTNMNRTQLSEKPLHSKVNAVCKGQFS
ncbi:MAG: asparaginase domain-containing protein [Nanoarchaeota archaeon]